MAGTSIGLVMEHTLDFYRQVLHGIREYGHENTDAKHFATVFRRVEGITPTVYRGRRHQD